MNFRLIAEQWDRIGQFYAAFPAGHATAAAALHRLNRFQASTRIWSGDVWLARSRRYGDIRKALLSAPAGAVGTSSIPTKMPS